MVRKIGAVDSSFEEQVNEGGRKEDVVNSRLRD